MKKIKKFLALILSICLVAQTIYADDNANSGSGDLENALKDKGFYRTNEYMYKVSVYVALADTVDENSHINTNFKMIGNFPIYIKPTSFNLPANLIGTKNNKIEYLNGGNISTVPLDQYLGDSRLPPIPITNNGNLNDVKSYFGDTNTLNNLLSTFAKQKGTTKKGLVSNIEFTIDGEKGLQDPNDILPLVVDGKYTNMVSWLVLYEPVTILYLKPDSSGYRQPIAYTATEYALDQRDGYFDFFWGPNGQFVAGMTHSDLPNSIVLEEDWVGLKAYPPLADGVYWSNERIIQGGGDGLRLLRPGTKADEVIETDNITYRTDTDVITSVKIFAGGNDIRPDNRDEYADNIENAGYTNPDDDKAYVTISTDTGQSITEEIVLPSGGSREVWLRWHTPNYEGVVNISVTLSGSPSAQLSGGADGMNIVAVIEDINKNEPPDPEATDKMAKNFKIPNAPNKIDNTTASWNTSSAEWKANIQWHENLILIPDESWIEDTQYEDGGYWEDTSYYEDHGWYEDLGEWDYQYQNYSARLTSTISLTPDIYCPTYVHEDTTYTMKSGYGVNVNTQANVSGTGDYTEAQTSITYFPEFYYENYWRVLKKTDSSTFEFKPNKYSTYENNRVHFTPLSYPDGEYEVYCIVRDVWTPGGELYLDIADTITISGNVYDDWSIVPTFPKD